MKRGSSRRSSEPAPSDRKPAPLDRTRAVLIAGLLVVAIVWAYRGGLHGPFIWDDLAHIPQNPRIRSFGWGALVGSSRPLVQLSFALNHALGGLEVFGYHVFNLVVHGLSATACFVLLRATLRTPRLAPRFGADSTLLAGAAAAIWALHPLQTEAVTYLVQRSEAMASLAYLLVLWTLLRSAHSRHAAAWQVTSVACCLAGIGCKAIMVSAPLIALLFDRAFLAGSFREAWARRGRVHVALWASLALFAVVLPAGARDWNASTGFGMEAHTALEYAITQLAVLPHYLRLAFWPAPLILDYAWPNAPIAGVLPGAAIMLGLGALTTWGVARNSAAGFLGAWFLLVLAPTSSIVPLADAAFEHRMYLPLAAVVAFAVFGAYRLLLAGATRVRAASPAAAPGPDLARGTLVVVVIAVIVVLARGTAHRNIDYRSAVAIWSDNIAKHPINPRPYVHLGAAYSKEGRHAEAMSAFDEALRRRPCFGPAIGNYAEELELLDRKEEALARYREALRCDPTLAWARYRLAVLLLGRRDVSGAEGELVELVRRRPDYATGRHGLAHVYLIEGRLDEACREFRATLALDPTNEDARRVLAEVEMRTSPSP